MAWLGECAGVGSFIIVSIPFFNLVCGSCWIFIVIADDITSDVAGFNDTVEILDDSDRTESVKRIRDIIQNYSDAKE